MPPDELTNGGRCNAEPPAHSEPGRGNVNVKNPDGLALQIIRRRQSQARRHPDDREGEADQQQPGRRGPGYAQETRRIGERVHHSVPYALPISRWAISYATSPPKE